MRTILAVTLAAGLAGCTPVDRAIEAQSPRIAVSCAKYEQIAPSIDTLLEAGALSASKAAKARQAQTTLAIVCAGPPPKNLTEAVVSAAAAYLTLKTIKEN
jgi:hypothetical protein